MIGGTVIEASNVMSPSGKQLLSRLWCVDARRPNDECAVYADPEEAADVRPGDSIWWQCGKIYWTRHNQDGSDEFVDRAIRKVGYSFDPRRDP